VVLHQVIPFSLAPSERVAQPPAQVAHLVRLVEDTAEEVKLLRHDSKRILDALESRSSAFPARLSSEASNLTAQYSVTTYHPTATTLDSAAKHVRLQLLGEFELISGGRHIAVGVGHKARMLLAHVAASHPSPRDKHELLGAFWPDSPANRASNNLSIAVHQIRNWLREVAPHLADTVTVRHGRYSLDTRWWSIDVAEFRANVAAARAAAATEDAETARRSYQRAFTCYAGSFLAAESAEQWALNIRHDLSLEFVDVAKWLARDAVSTRHWARVIELAERIRAEDDVDEEAYQLQMLGHWRQGNVTRALAAYRNCVERLREALDLHPAPVTEHLYNEIRARGIAPRGL
jgi:DNA-binding SARP family transcriptional activator